MGSRLGLCATGQLMVKDLEHSPGRVFKLPADDIMPHHDGTYDIYWLFGDVVYIMALATAIASTMRFDCVRAERN